MRHWFRGEGIWEVLELNNHSMDPDCNRQNAVENDTVMLNLCKKYQVPVVMDSDAHFDLLIGGV